MLNVGSLPCNCWLAGGALLLDAQVDTVAALDCLLSAVVDLPWPALLLDQVPYADETWRAFRAAAGQAGLSVSVREHYQIGQVEIGHDWDVYKARLKGDHRRKLNRYVRKLDEAGGAELKVYREMTPEMVEDLTRRAFEVEDRSWKGDQKTSVLKSPSIFAHYVHEGQALANAGQLEIAFLEQRGRPMAFVWGYSGKGVFYTTKLGYDEEFAKFGPGQQLLLRLLQSFHADPARRLLDFAGPLASFHQVWTTRSYPVGPLLVATPKVLGRSLFHVYTQWQPRAKRLHQKLSASLASVRAAATSAIARTRSSLKLSPSTAQPAGPAATTDSDSYN
jgi:CelD/BcsL family acetyltransferase involved in cellulose biosynthesis